MTEKKIKEDITDEKDNKDNKEDKTKEIKLPYFSSIHHLSEILNQDILELTKKYKEIINKDISDNLELLNNDDIELFLLELGYERVEFMKHESKPIKRSIIVTIMGHVDHGKTTLLDVFRQSKLVDNEYGKITQSIGAFSVETKNNDIITFIDTPGHEAFIKMRQRGAKVTDGIILVISAVEGVQNQTLEVINIALGNKIPIIVAINKVDRNGADPEAVVKELKNAGLNLKSDGGSIPIVEISAKNKINIDKLEDEIINLSKSLNLMEETNIPAQCFVIESKTAHNLQAYNALSSSVIVVKGILRENDCFVCGEAYGKVKSMLDDKSNTVKEVEPGKAIILSGFKSPPVSGSVLCVVDNMNVAERIIQNRKRFSEYINNLNKKNIGVGIKLGKMKNSRERHILMKKGDKKKLEEKIESIMQSGKTFTQDERTIRDIYLKKGIHMKKIILKSDSIGSLEAIMDEIYNAFEDHDLVNAFILQSSVGMLTEEEIKIAQSADCVIFTFNFDKDEYTSSLSYTYQVGIRMHKLIFNLVEEVKHYIYECIINDPDFDLSNNFKSRSVIKDIFQIKFKDKTTKLAGLEVEQGDLHISNRLRICNTKKVIKTNLSVGSLKQNKSSVQIVREGEDCGLIINNYEDFQVGDYIDGYEIDKKFEGISNTKNCVSCYN